MIQKMSKYSFVIYHKEYEAFLHYLQGLGVVHITERTNPREAEELRQLTERRAYVANLGKSLATAIGDALPEVDEVAEALPQLAVDEAKARTQALAERLEAREALLLSLQAKKQEIAEQEVWGEFAPEQLEALRASGYPLSFYTIASSAFSPSYEAEWEAVEVARRGATTYFVRIEREGAKPAPDAERVKSPEKSLSTLRAELSTLEGQLTEQTAQLTDEAPTHAEALRAHEAHLSAHYRLGAARLQAIGGAEDKLMLLEGWVPTSGAKAMEADLNQTGYYYQEVEIVDEDRIPILLKNNFFARLFEPITAMFSMPNYGELDQTALFAPFFLLFFGLCFGDGGYGLLLFVVATFFRLKSKKPNGIITLLQWLGGGAFIIGMLMGTFFGVTLGYAKAEDYFLNQDNLMKLSVVLGLVQIFFAKGVAAYKIKVQRGVKYSLAPFAWIFFLLALGALIALPRLSLDPPSFVPYLIYGIVGVTAAIILFYNTPGKNPFLNVGSALWTAYNTASGLLGDTLSYIRLFAIGLTGGILGGVFNQLAVEQTEGLPWAVRIPMMIIVLTIGHGLNISLAMISSFVHPLRLTFVEYYKNSEFEGGGKAYDPLRSNQ